MIKGNVAANYLWGRSGADLLEGKSGNDRIDGGIDIDTAVFSGRRSDYIVTQKADGSFLVADKRSAGDGTDTVTDVESFGFSDRTVRLVDLLSTNPAEPEAPSDRIVVGTRLKDVLTGGTGADKLKGGYGNDVLTGGAGADVFVFNATLGTWRTDRKKNFDTITDFTPREDRIWLDNKIFKKLGKAGSESAPAALKGKFFKLGKAKDKNDYIAYNKKTGVVSYDMDGSGTRYKAVEMMKIATKVSLSAADFLVV
ncbi:calcium-binding protein [Microvirga splendida]|uniref:Peptidase M10 serralysin C-terminal domain-containing protein n=1 Tax=Microvirga splendida TaxID=2795727 RepID=A0ABS0Y1U0_9HYPH|nr:hypothetical protein [Microvirga splendida]